MAANIINLTAAQQRVAQDIYHNDRNAAFYLQSEIASIVHLTSLNRQLTGKEATELAATVRGIDKDLLTANYADQVNALTGPAKVASLDTIKKRSTVENLALGYNQTPNSAVADSIHDTYRAVGLWGRSDDDTRSSYKFVKSAVDSLPKADPNAINHSITRQDYWDLVNQRDDLNRYAANTSRGFEKPSGWNQFAHPIEVGTAGILVDDVTDGIGNALSRILGDLLGNPVILGSAALLLLLLLKR